MPSREGPITRRQMLSYVSSLYDPLGLISPVVLQGKVLFQDATALKLGWDDNVPLHLENKWWEWLDSLPELNELSFNRCVVPDSFENGVFELHHFSDASERSYGACSYLRVITPQGKSHVSLLASKGRLAPLKTLSVPRLELSAALTAAKLDELIRKHFELHTIDSMFWTDSEIVLAYSPVSKDPDSMEVQQNCQKRFCSGFHSSVRSLLRKKKFAVIGGGEPRQNQHNPRWPPAKFVKLKTCSFTETNNDKDMCDRFNHIYGNGHIALYAIATHPEQIFSKITPLIDILW